MVFPATPLDVLVEMAIGADPTADPDSWDWTDITDWVLVRDGISITRGRQDRLAVAGPTLISMTVDNTGGRFVARNPLAPWYPDLRRGVPIRVSIDGVVRATGFVDELPVRWDVSGADQHVPLKASGILKRLSKPDSRVVSAPRRWIPTSAPIVYWPLEEGPSAKFAAPDVGTGRMVPWTGKHPSGAVATFPRWGTGSLGPWLPPVFSFPGSSGLNILVGRVDMPGTPTVWTLGLMIAASTGSETVTVDINPGYLTGDLAWPQLIMDPVAGEVLVALNGEPEQSVDAPGLYDGLGHHVRLTAIAAGSKVSWTVYLDGRVAGSGLTAGNMTLPPVESIGLVSSGSGGASVGHVAAWTTQPSNVDLGDSCRGWPDEPAGWRIERLFTEIGVPWVVVGGNPASDDTQRMGQQPYATALACAREAEAVDGGILAEATTGEIEYLPGRSRYNRAVDLALDYEQGHVAPPFEPTDDEQGTVNDITVTRSAGGQHRATDDAHIARYGRAEDSTTLNVPDEDDLPDQASWRLHLGTVDELRYARLVLDLARNPDLIPDWLACRIGSRLTVANPPPELPPDVIDQHVVGYTEAVDSFSWRVEANLEPASGYTVGVGEDPVLGRADTSGSVVLRGFAAGTDTTLLVAVTAGPPWITTAAFPGQFPVDVRSGGVVLTVTGIDAAPPLNTNPFFEAAAAPWTSVGGTVTRSTTQAHQGVASLLLTPSGSAATVDARAENVTAVPGLGYHAQAWVRCAVARSVTIAINWRDGGGSLVSTSTASTSLAAATWTLLTLDATAPAGTAQAQLLVTMGSTPPATHTLHIDEAELTAAGSQRFTVSPAPANGVVRTIPAGTPVSLAHPMIAGL